MKAALVTTNKFHFFEAAHELKRRGLLGRVISGYPRRLVHRSWMEPGDLVSRPLFTSLFMASNRMFQDTQWQRELEWRAHEWVDKRAASHLEGCQAVMAMCCTGLHCGAEMQKRGGKLLIDRPVLHIETQDAVLAEEYGRAGVPYKPIDKRKVDKEKAEYEACDFLLAPSQIVRRSMEAKGVPAGKIRVLSLGADVAKFRPEGRAGRQGFEIIFAGNVSIQKGIRVLAEAVEKLAFSPVRVVLAGRVLNETAPFLARLEKSCTLEVLGSIGQDQLRQAMNRASVLVLPSVQDGFGVVVPQAMACGVPVVVSTMAGASEIVAHGLDGFVFESGNAAALAECLERLASDESLRSEMGQAALAKAATVGGLQAYGDGLEAVLQEACG